MEQPLIELFAKCFLTLFFRVDELDRKVKAMSENQTDLATKVGQLAADEADMETRVNGLVDGLAAQLLTANGAIADLKQQIANGQAPDLTAIGDSLDALDAKIKAFRAPAPTPTPEPQAAPATDPAPTQS